MEDLFGFALLLRGRSARLTGRCSERNERAMKAIDTLLERIRSQAAGHAGRQRTQPA